MNKYFVTTGDHECGVCGGTGTTFLSMQEGGGDAICYLCDGAGVLGQRLVPLEDALREMEHRQIVTGEDARAAANALDYMRYTITHGGAEERISAFALAAIAEQLALLNGTLAAELGSISESQRDIARAAIGF